MSKTAAFHQSTLETRTVKLMPRKRFPLYCSFCGKSDHEVGYLVAGPSVFICNECVELCREIGQTMLVETSPPQEPKP